MDEEQEKNDGEVTSLPKKPMRKRLKDNWHVFLKILETALCIVCIGLIYEPIASPKITSGHIYHLGLLYTGFSGYILINCVLFTTYLFKEKIGFRTSALFSICGAGLNLVSSVLIFTDREHFRNSIFHPHMYLLPLLMTCSACALVNGIIFAVDAVATFRTKKDFGCKE